MNIDPASTPSLASNIDLFNTKPLVVGYAESSVISYLPVSAIGSYPLQFHINSGLTFIDLKQSYFTLLLRISKKVITKNTDGTETAKIVDISTADKCAFVNNIGGSVIKNLKFSINSKQVENTQDLMSYKSYFSNLLNLDGRPKGMLEASGYFDETESSQTSGKVFDRRKAFFVSDSFELIVPLNLDLATDKLLIPQLMLDFELTVNNNFFSLIADQPIYNYHIQDVRLNIKHHNLLPALSLEIEKKLEAGNLAVYPFVRKQVNNFFISPNRYEYNSLLYQNFLPSRIFVALCDAKKFNGTYNSSPFEFNHFNLISAKILANGKQLPTNSFKQDFPKKRYTQSYYELLRNAKNCNLSLENFLAHSTVFAFQLCNSDLKDAIEPQTIGAVSISLSFSQPVQESGLQLITFSLFPTTIAFNNQRQIIQTFGSI